MVKPLGHLVEDQNIKSSKDSVVPAPAGREDRLRVAQLVELVGERAVAVHSS
jgi:hypothetical protein